MQDITTSYYNSNAMAFIKNTMEADISSLREKFISYLPANGYILDWGCGSARDSLAFMEHGYRLDSVDKSEKLCELARLNFGINVNNQDFLELDAVDKYDGIWACASLLHVKKKDMAKVFRIAKRALKTGGVMYASFKYGNFEGEKNGRYFTNMTLEEFEKILPVINDETDDFKLELEESWISLDVREDREGEKWLNLILKKVD